jgi:hypothetical protein
MSSDIEGYKNVGPLQPEGSTSPGHYYRYTSLPPNSFRFAHLLPGAENDAIQIWLELKVVRQEDDPTAPQWEALSWLWGAYGDFRTIVVNGQDFKITRNLFIALRHLRQRKSARLLWVDALCINQEDLAERSSQISQMAFLFHRARRVIAWLGEGNPGSQIVMRLARHLYDFESGNLISCDENIMYILALTFGVPRVKANLSNSLFHYWNIHKFENWSHIDRMAERELFRRSWVLQEGALAIDLVVQCGKETIPWDALFRAVSLRYAYDSRARDSPIISEGWSAMQAIETLRQLVATKQRPPDLLELLWACRNYKSTDPRDRIFALLGVSNLLYGQGPQQQLGFEIDYSKPVRNIFRSFTLSMIAKYRDLRVLATRRPNRAYDDGGLGSWCPDWSSLDGGVSLLYRQRQWSENMVHYRASGDTVPLFGAKGDEASWKPALEHAVATGCLTLHGFKLDTIAAVRHSSHFESDNTRLYDWHHWAVWPEEREWTETPQPRGQADPQRQDAFWRTVIADADANGNRHPIYLRAQFLVWYQKIVEGFKTSNDFTVETSVGEEYKDFLNRMRQATKGRCLFETDEYGFLGIGDQDHSAEQGGPQLQPGDIIAILYGGPLPVLLREVSGQLDNHGKCTYKLIGDAFCYVHGAVDGEALYLNDERTQEFTII